PIWHRAFLKSLQSDIVQLPVSMFLAIRIIDRWHNLTPASVKSEFLSCLKVCISRSVDISRCKCQPEDGLCIPSITCHRLGSCRSFRALSEWLALGTVLHRETRL